MCDSCEHEEILEQINEMCEDEAFDFASDTLSGIAEWIENNEHVTPKQVAAIENIRRAVEDR